MDVSMKEKVALAKFENWLLGLSLVCIMMKRNGVFEISKLFSQIYSNNSKL